MTIRLFLDANVLFAAAASPQGGSALVGEGCTHGRCEGVVSRLVLLEAERNLRNKAMPGALARYHRWLEATPLQVVVAPTTMEIQRYLGLIHEKDAPVLAAAVASQAAYLVTLDRRHFMTATLRRAHLPLRIVTPKEMLQSLPRRLPNG